MKIKLKTSLLILAFLFIFGLVVPYFAMGAEAGFNKVGATAGISSNSNLLSLVQTVISGALGVVGFIFFGMVLYGGLRWMTARGKEELKEKALNAIENAIIGLVIVIGAYAITTFVFSQLNPDKTATPSTPTANSQQPTAEPTPDESGACYCFTGNESNPISCDIYDSYSDCMSFCEKDNFDYFNKGETCPSPTTP